MVLVTPGSGARGSRYRTLRLLSAVHSGPPRNPFQPSSSGLDRPHHPRVVCRSALMVPGRRTGEKGSRLLDLGGPCVVGARRTSILCVHPLLSLRTAHGLQVGVNEKCTS